MSSSECITKLGSLVVILKSDVNGSPILSLEHGTFSIFSIYGGASRYLLHLHFAGVSARGQRVIIFGQSVGRAPHYQKSGHKLEEDFTHPRGHFVSRRGPGSANGCCVPTVKVLFFVSRGRATGKCIRGAISYLYLKEVLAFV